MFEYICFCLNIADRVYFPFLFTGCLELSSTLIILGSVSVADPDHPDCEIRGPPVSKFFLRLFGPQFGLKIRAGGCTRAPPLDPPLFSTWRCGDSRRSNNFGKRKVLLNARNQCYQ